MKYPEVLKEFIANFNNKRLGTKYKIALPIESIIEERRDIDDALPSRTPADAFKEPNNKAIAPEIKITFLPIIPDNKSKVALKISNKPSASHFVLLIISVHAFLKVVPIPLKETILNSIIFDKASLTVVLVETKAFFKKSKVPTCHFMSGFPCLRVNVNKSSKEIIPLA